MILKRFYHCKRLPDEYPDIKRYSAPVEKWGNYNPSSGYLSTVEYGQKISYMWTMVLPMNGNEKEYHIDDLLYLDGKKPEKDSNGYENGDGANARIVAVKLGYRAIILDIEGIIER